MGVLRLGVKYIRRMDLQDLSSLEIESNVSGQSQIFNVDGWYLQRW